MSQARGRQRARVAPGARFPVGATFGDLLGDEFLCSEELGEYADSVVFWHLPLVLDEGCAVVEEDTRIYRLLVDETPCADRVLALARRHVRHAIACQLNFY